MKLIFTLHTLLVSAFVPASNIDSLPEPRPSIFENPHNANENIDRLWLAIDARCTASMYAIRVKNAEGSTKS